MRKQVETWHGHKRGHYWDNCTCPECTATRTAASPLPDPRDTTATWPLYRHSRRVRAMQLEDGRWVVVDGERGPTMYTNEEFHAEFEKAAVNSKTVKVGQDKVIVYE
jgi:hypothetical protein